jgi:catechol 2,3-dioxygenase-like lactoylglutathione lyase family enzyme
MQNFIRITPFMHVADVDAAVRFFTGILGFKAWFHAPGIYAYVQREVAAIRIGSADCEVDDPSAPHSYRYYIDVEDVASVIAEVRPKLLAAGLPGGEGPIDQSYGQREFLILAPDGYLLVFGQGIV